VSKNTQKTKGNDTKSNTTESAIKRFEAINQRFVDEMSQGKTAHDVIFKIMMEKPEILTAYLKVELPKNLVNQIEWSGLTYESTNQVNSIIDEKRCDLLVALPLKSGIDIYVYCMFEHQSTDDKRMTWRFFEYIYLWYQKYIQSNGHFPDKLPFIYPLLLYNGTNQWQSPTKFQDLIQIPKGCQQFVPHFEFQLKDLSQIEDNAIKTQYIQSFALMKFIEYFKYSRESSFKDRFNVDGEFVLLENEYGDLLFSITLYILQSQKDFTTFETMIKNKLRKEDNMLDVVAELKNLGREEGRNEGLNEGINIGREKVMKTAGRLKHMGLSNAQIAKATGLSITEVERIEPIDDTEDTLKDGDTD